MKRYILLFLLSLMFFCQSAFAKVAEISPVCSAAVHAGLISPTKGGSFLATIERGQSRYQGSNQNGVTSQSYYAYWFGSYRLSALDNAPSPNFTLAYDAAGNVTQKGDLSLTYNQANRLATASQSSLVAEYRYNAEGVRSSKTVNGKHTDYIYSGSRLLAWKDNQGWHENIYLNGEIIATVDNGKVHYHENDYQGKTLRLVNEQGNTVWTADWQPYRESDKPQNGINNPQRFAGQILDEETGFYYNHFREYDPQTGRYTQSDPIGLNGGVNTYAYVGGNPVMFVDPLGLETEIIQWGSSGNWYGSGRWGHISGNINGKNWSFGPSGWDTTRPQFSDYAERQASDLDRGGRGAVLDLSIIEERKLESCLSNHNTDYSGITNNCGNPFLSCLAELDDVIDLKDKARVLPIDVYRILKKSPRLIRENFYPGKRIPAGGQKENFQRVN